MQFHCVEISMFVYKLHFVAASSGRGVKGTASLKSLSNSWKSFLVLGLGCLFPGPHAINFCTAINQFCGWCEKVFYMCVFATPTYLERHLIIQFGPKIVEENFLRQLTIGQGVPKWASVWVYKRSVCVCVYGCLVEWQVVYTRRFFINHFPWQRLERGGREKGIENDYCHSIGLFSFKTIMIVRLFDTKCGPMKSSNLICKP